MSDWIGQQLGPYHVMRLLGKGSFASVYQAEHIYLKTPVAIKILYTRLAPDALEHFLTEARRLSQLAHPQIVRILNFDIANETPFLVMEYAPGGTLREQHLTGTPVALPTVVSYIKQIA